MHATIPTYALYGLDTIPADVIESARIVSAYRGETMAGLLGEILRPALAKMEQEEIARRAGSVQ
jgi:hypothetical protein